MTFVGTFGSLQIRTWEGCDTVEVKQVRFPRSKKKRIRKKWAANPANWKTTPVSHMYVFGGTVLMSPTEAARVRLKAIEVQP